MSWKPEVLVEGKWTPNGMRFGSKQEAERQAADTYRRWMLADDHRATESDDPVNWRLSPAGELEQVKV